MKQAWNSVGANALTVRGHTLADKTFLHFPLVRRLASVRTLCAGVGVRLVVGINHMHVRRSVSSHLSRSAGSAPAFGSYR